MIKLEPALFEGTLKEWVEEQFNTYNARQGFNNTRVEFCFVARNENEEILGVARGFMQGQWLNVNDLIIAPAYRQKGLGSQLLAQAEALAKAQGCRGITLNTLGIQAPKFYLKHGYEEFARLENFGATSKHFFKKRLSPPPRSSRSTGLP